MSRIASSNTATRIGLPRSTPPPTPTPQPRSRASGDAAGADAYYGLACQDLKLRRRDPFGLVRKSLYVYQVLHYRAVHGAERVTAVSAEQLKRDAPGAGRTVAAHVGLCASFSFGAGQRVHATRARVSAGYGERGASLPYGCTQYLSRFAL